ncbi:hypothetical protein PHISCL_00657 [Aspergillus sclerotialis]|uniref:Uncharacterized protein n=1 Tax=Aspergillus sclerotialis TaxID=2070753 RepID=A0A3A2ZV70_9EURO|nr:hypothetical protein PHISCL_00657 [Aspergillus sclerotialis]
MASLKLRLKDYEERDIPVTRRKDLLSSVKSKFRHESSAYKTVGTTGYSDAKVSRILEEILQPNSKRSLEDTVQAILSLVPDNASMSNEVSDVGDVCLELAEQIPYHHPSQIKLARVVEKLARSEKFMNGPDEKVNKSHNCLWALI